MSDTLFNLEEDSKKYAEHLKMAHEIIEKSDSVYFNYFEYPDECDYLIKRIPLDNPIRHIFMKSGTIIEQKAIINALKTERMVEIYKSGSLRAEYFPNHTDWVNRLQKDYITIDPTNSVGKILGVEDYHLYLLPTDRYYELGLDNMKLEAHMRALYDTENKNVIVVTWDLIPVEEERDENS